MVRSKAFYRDLSQDYLSYFKEKIFSEELPGETLSEVRAVLSGFSSTLLPESLGEDGSGYEAFFYPSETYESMKLLTTPLPALQQVLVYAVEESLYYFLLRLFPAICFEHQSALLINRFLQSEIYRNEKVAMLYCAAAYRVVLIKDAPHRVLINTYRTGSLNDTCYYLLCLYQTLKLDQLQSPLWILGSEIYTRPVEERLQPYVKNIYCPDEEDKFY